MSFFGWFSAFIAFAFCKIMYDNAKIKTARRHMQPLNLSSNCPIHILSCLGNFPGYVFSYPQEVFLAIDIKGLGIWISGSNSVHLFTYDQVISATTETKESITAGRIIAMGLLALACKKKTDFLKVTIENGYIFHMVFQTESAGILSQQIMNAKYSYRVKQGA